MRMKINQKMAGGASAIDRLYEIAVIADNFAGDVYDIVTSAEIMQASIEQLFEGSDAAPYLKNEQLTGYSLIPSTDRRYLAYQINDTTVRARSLEKLADDLSSQLLDLRKQMKEADDAPVATTQPSLNAVVAEWRTAYEAWEAADNGKPDQFDTPEGLRERQALIALAQHPCATLDEVRRKAGLFQTDQYLNGNAPDLVPDLLRSFAEAGGA